MALEYTHIFIKTPINELVDAASIAPSAHMIDDEEEIYLFGGSTIEKAQFALGRDRHNSNHDGWSELYHIAPNSYADLSLALKSLRVPPRYIEVGTDGNGQPLLDIAKLKALMAKIPRIKSSVRSKTAKILLRRAKDRNASFESSISAKKSAS